MFANINKLYELQGDKTDTEFAKELGISRSQLWRIKNRKSSIGTTVLAKFKTKYPDEKMEDYFYSDDVRQREHRTFQGTVEKRR